MSPEGVQRPIGQDETSPVHHPSTSPLPKKRTHTMWDGRLRCWDGPLFSCWTPAQSANAASGRHERSTPIWGIGVLHCQVVGSVSNSYSCNAASDDAAMNWGLSPTKCDATCCKAESFHFQGWLNGLGAACACGDAFRSCMFLEPTFQPWGGVHHRQGMLDKQWTTTTPSQTRSIDCWAAMARAAH